MNTSYKEMHHAIFSCYKEKYRIVKLSNKKFRVERAFKLFWVLPIFWIKKISFYDWSWIFWWILSENDDGIIFESQDDAIFYVRKACRKKILFKSPKENIIYES